MSGMQSVNSVSFGSNYIIPFNQIKDSATMRSIGQETAKYADPAKDMMKTNDGIVVRVDDKNDKEYEAIIAKYGVNIKKYDGQFTPNPNMEQESYSFMVSKLHPDDAQKRIEAYKAMNDEQKGQEFIKTYTEFKNSPHSVENQSKDLPQPKLKPTDKPIIKFPTKDGKNMMAREVQLENGYKCMAVSDEKNPDQATLMNHKEFQQYMLENTKQI